MLLKIGELAKRTGMTVRTLHHYDAIGLLSPSARTESGYRLYNRADIERLHRIQALRRLELPLAEIATLLEGGGADLQTVIGQQIAALEQQLERTAELRDRLKALQLRIDQNIEPDLPDWLVTLEMMSMYDKYFTREERRSLQAVAESVRAELNALVLQVREVMNRGLPPDSPEAQALARPWLDLGTRYMVDDARLMLKHEAMHRNELAVQTLTGVDNPMLDYMVRATAEYRFRVYTWHLPGSMTAKVRASYFSNYTRWPALFADLRQLHDEGADPCSAAGQDLCTRWLGLFMETWGSDPVLLEEIRRVNREDPDVLLGTGLTPQLLDFLERGATQLREQHQMKEHHE